MLTIVEDHSQATWTFLLNNKTQVPITLRTFINMIKNQYHTNIKVVRSSNGTEFFNTQCAQLFTENGIIHQRSCAHSPQQNEVVECKHYHLLQVAHSLMFQANMPKHFLVESFLVATYIINKLPVKVLNWITLYESLNGHVLNYSKLWIFRCLC